MHDIEGDGSRILGGWRHVVSARANEYGPHVVPVRAVSLSDDASILEPLPSLPWLTTFAAHGKTRGESAICCGDLD